MAPRVASAVLASALIRRAEAEGGFGVVVAKGDETAGAIAVILAEKGRKACLLERALQPDGRYAWQASSQDVEKAEEFERLLKRKRSFDPDLWIVELDIASAERFAAEMSAFD
ncbi:DUF1491 family protein [Sphingosinicella sp. LHD-64]|uniref:DUF1491 family protein n=1 Tax=Sphingosinicella sp. LHD-64 TaxID=3072139 RepID=UPI00280C60C4|nr:DUF1491 family protein [Sphingosinicella sp. LHD-64]MDQ8757017.1 DUF1491 family protein [Sphingosinicella sp. LHD-64]